MKNWSFLYAILKLFVNTAHYLFYRHIVVTNSENIPEDGPLIFVPNHQNALMDALAVICTTKRQIVFLARADIFKNPFQSWVLGKFKILPVYRIRDGAESLKENEEIFRQCIEILHNNMSLALFPETTHHDKRRLQNLKKGVPRIAFLAEEKSDFRSGVQIVPVGIYFSHYQNYYSTLQVNYGNPFEIGSFAKEYYSSPQKAMMLLKEKMAEQIRPLMIDIKSAKYYDLFEKIRELYDFSMTRKSGKKLLQAEKFIADKNILNIMDAYAENHDSELQELDLKVDIYYNLLKKTGFRDWLFDSTAYSKMLIILKCLLFIPAVPFILYGIVSNYLPYWITEKVVKSTKDKQFHSSIKFGLGLVLFPVYYIILLVLLSYLTGNLLLLLLLFAGMPLSSKIWFAGTIRIKKIFSVIRFVQLSDKNDTELNELKNLRKEIISNIDEIVFWYSKQNI